MKYVAKALVMVCLAVPIFIPCGSYAHDGLKPANLSKMTFEELVKVKVFVPAAITQLLSTQVPASVTVITAEDIQQTPARNIYDLIGMSF